MKHWIHWMVILERWLAFASAFAIVVYLILSLNDWSNSFNRYFLLTENWGSLVFLFLFVLAVNFMLRKLLVWQFRESSR